jgi:hypothetical protein
MFRETVVDSKIETESFLLDFFGGW